MNRVRVLVSAVKSFIESRPATAVFLIALMVRIVVVAGIAIVIEGGLGLFPDDAFYNHMAIDAATDKASQWNEYTRGLYWRTASFTWPLTGLYVVFGPIPWIGQLLAALFGATAAGLTTRVGIEARLGTNWSILAGAIVAFLPSQVLFSSITLKDAAVWAVLAGLGVVVAMAARRDGHKLLGLAFAVVVLIVLMRHLRVHTLVVSVWAVAIAAWFSQQHQRMQRGTGAFLIFLFLPFAFGLGPAGLDFIKSAGSLEGRRAANAANADTAFAPTKEQLAEARSGKPDSNLNNDGRTGDVGHDDGRTGDVGHDDGRTGKEQNIEEESGETDRTEPSDTSERGGVTRDLKHLPYGATVMLAGPFPWWGDGNSRLQLAQLAMILWYPVLLSAVVGLFFLWRYRQAMAFPVLAGGGMLLVYALAEGNFGTAYRHRGEFVWVVALLAAIGLKHTVDWMRSRRTTRT